MEESKVQLTNQRRNHKQDNINDLGEVKRER